MNKGFHLFEGDVVGFLNSDDTFHDPDASADIAAGLQNADIVYGDLNMVTDHRTKRIGRGVARRNIQPLFVSARLGAAASHLLHAHAKLREKVGDYDLSYVTTADYDYMLRALALNDFRARYLPRVHRRLPDGRHLVPAASASPSAAIWNACDRDASI